MPIIDFPIRCQSNILLIGLLLLTGLFSGQLAGKIGIPRVAAYVLTGTTVIGSSSGMCSSNSLR
jgi:NhaP-type Na+/H+ or K+/H+ antiporter